MTTKGALCHNFFFTVCHVLTYNYQYLYALPRQIFSFLPGHYNTYNIFHDIMQAKQSIC